MKNLKRLMDKRPGPAKIHKCYHCRKVVGISSVVAGMCPKCYKNSDLHLLSGNKANRQCHELDGNGYRCQSHDTYWSTARNESHWVLVAVCREHGAEPNDA